MNRTLKKWWYRLIGMTPAKMRMVHYWKKAEHVEAALKTVDGYQILEMQGEAEPIRGYPRGHLLIPQGVEYGPFSVLKHQMKQVFNRIWEHKDPNRAKEDLKATLKYLEPLKYDLVPQKHLVPSVREIHRAWTKVAPEYPELRDALCLILQEDDAYRYRVMYIPVWFPLMVPFIKRDPVKILAHSLDMITHQETVNDMKERIQLLKHGLMTFLQDEKIKDKFIRFFREVNWKKVKVTESERYHARAKYFRADLDVLEY